MRTIQHDDDLVIGALDVEECLVLLRWEVIGRLAVASPGSAPSVVPINFTLHDGTILFRSHDGEKLRLLQRELVSLQVDRFDLYRKVGWSVLVKGIATEVDPAEVSHVELATWAPGDKTHVIRITPTEITGRRLELKSPALDGRAYL